MDEKMSETILKLVEDQSRRLSEMQLRLDTQQLVLAEQSAKINTLETLVEKLSTDRAGNNGVYTDEELAELKESLSWKKLSERTGIKLSTLQYRLRRYYDR